MHLTPNLGILELAVWWRSEDIFEPASVQLSEVFNHLWAQLIKCHEEKENYQHHKVYQIVNGESWINYVLNDDPSGRSCISLEHTDLMVCSAVAAGYEPTTAPTPTAPAWQGRSIGTSKLRLVEFSAFLEQQRDPDSVSFSFFLFFLFFLFSALHRTTPDISPTVTSAGFVFALQAESLQTGVQTRVFMHHNLYFGECGWLFFLCGLTWCLSHLLHSTTNTCLCTSDRPTTLTATPCWSRWTFVRFMTNSQRRKEGWRSCTGKAPRTLSSS